MENKNNENIDKTQVECEFEELDELKDTAQMSLIELNNKLEKEERLRKEQLEKEERLRKKQLEREERLRKEQLEKEEKLRREQMELEDKGLEREEKKEERICYE